MTASPSMQTERARMDPEGSVNQLLAALGTGGTQRELAAFNEQHEQRKLEEQKGKFDWYVEQFQKDRTEGAVSRAQVKERFPETVPVIASRIAEAVGSQQGKKQFQAAIDEVDNNDALRLDTAARAEFLKKKRDEIVNGVGQGNEFYGAGVVSAMDRLMSQHEMNWQSQTAQYHQKVQNDEFSSEVVGALNSSDPQNKLLELDAKWKAFSSLNDLERNKNVVNSAIDLAFVNDDPKVLQAVPARFLNVDSTAQLEKARVQLTDRRIVNLHNAEFIRKVQRDEALRTSKLAMIADVIAGKQVDPAAYRNDSEAYQFALQMREAPRVDQSASTAVSQAIRNSVLDSSSAGPGMTLENFRDVVLSRADLNPADKQKLIDEAPKLIEGRNLMADDAVRQPVTDRLAPRLQALESSTNSAIQSLLTGRNLRSEVMKGYDLDIRRSFQAEFEETGQWPKGHRKLELVDKAVERAEKRLEDATKIGSASSSKGEASTPATKPSAAPSRATPSAATGLPKGVVKLN